MKELGDFLIQFERRHDGSNDHGQQNEPPQLSQYLAHDFDYRPQSSVHFPCSLWKLPVNNQIRMNVYR
jgi:hypothetical protein